MQKVAECFTLTTNEVIINYPVSLIGKSANLCVPPQINSTHHLAHTEEEVKDHSTISSANDSPHKDSTVKI